MKIIVGLGNPGKKYQTTRHNLGFRVVEQLAKSQNLDWQVNKKWQAEIARGADWLLVKPLTYMNNSGQTVKKILDYYDLLAKDEEGKIQADSDLKDQLTVIHDELDVDLGKYKISVGSSSAGHHGVQSIIEAIKSQNFTRARLGIKTPELEKIPSDKFVLQKLSAEETTAIEKILPAVLANF